MKAVSLNTCLILFSRFFVMLSPPGKLTPGKFSAFTTDVLYLRRVLAPQAVDGSPRTHP
jgi:hypothetical protein